MDIFRFDPEVAVPASELGSGVRIGRLTGDGMNGRLQILYLAPGGTINGNWSSERQLLAVVSGRGWVSGANRSRRPLLSGQAAMWEAGEEREAGSEDGLTAIWVEGSFEVRALSVTREIIVVEYDPAWPGWFEQVRHFVWPSVAGLAVRIEHVGSTSVPGMAAKPIIDMDIVVSTEDRVQPVIAALAGIGYEWMGDLGVEGRQAFRPPGRPELPAHHLYLVVEGGKAHLDHVLLRDLLSADHEAARRYADLKRANAELAQGDMDFYVAAKARLVAELLTRARAERGLDAAEYWDPELPGLS